MKGPQLVLAGLVVGLSAFPAVAQDCSGSTTFLELLTQSKFPVEALFTSRADLSNPGARALALGGAFISSADDSTGAVANPAGLTALVRPTIQAEGRYLPLVRYEPSGSGLLTPGRDNGSSTSKTGAGTGFASVALPFADIFVADVFYQRVLTEGDAPTREGASLAAGPCVSTKNPFGGTALKMFLPYGERFGSASIDRFGVAIGARLNYRLSVGVTGFYASERLDQSFFQYEAGQRDNVSGTVTSGSSGKVGAILGLQLTASESLRIGATYSLPVEFANDSALKQTVLPARAGLGITVSPAASGLSIALEGVWVGTSRLADATDFSRLFATPVRAFEDARSADRWDVKDTFELRLGVEYAVVQSRTQTISLRAGAFTETLALLRYRPSAASTDPVYASDTVRTLFPDQDDPRLYHVSAGVGALFRKKVQADLGVDYETKTGRVAVSGLFGYTF